MNIKFLSKLTATIAALLALTNAQAADLTVEIAGVTEAKGEVMIALFNKSEGWLKNGISAKTVAAANGMVQVQFTGLPEGDYAFSVMHDVNGNGKLDTNPIGIPVEPYGFSNDAAGNFGPPSFDQAKFKLGNTNQTVRAKLS